MPTDTASVQLVRRSEDRGYRARRDRFISQGRVIAVDEVTRTVVLDVAAYNAAGSPQYLSGVPYQPTHVPQVNDLVSIDYLNSSPHSMTIGSASVGGANTDVIVQGGITDLKWIIITKFGARDDLTFDSTASIVAALATAKDGDVVYLPPTKFGYKITDRITVNKSITLLGFGATVHQATADKGSFYVTSAAPWFEGLRLTGPRYATGHPNEIAIEYVGPTAEELVLNGGFETGPGGMVGDPLRVDFPSWTRSGDGYSLWYQLDDNIVKNGSTPPDSTGFYPHAGTYALHTAIHQVYDPDLRTEKNFIAQVISTVAGTTYTFSLWYAWQSGHTGNPITLYWNGAVVADYTNPTADYVYTGGGVGWHKLSVTVVGTGSDELKIGYGSFYGDFFIDDVSLNAGLSTHQNILKVTNCEFDAWGGTGIKYWYVDDLQITDCRFTNLVNRYMKAGGLTSVYDAAETNYHEYWPRLIGTKGDLVVWDAGVGANAALPAGANDYVLVPDSSLNPGLKYRNNSKSLADNGSTALNGDVTLTGGANITLTQSGQDISVAAAIPAAFAGWIKVTKTYTDFSDATNQKDISIYTLPAKAVLHGFVVKHSVPFNDAVSCVLSLGITGSFTKYTTPFDVKQAPGNTVLQSTDGVYCEDYGATTSVRAQMTGSLALNLLTTGSVDIWLSVSTLP